MDQVKVKVTGLPSLGQGQSVLRGPGIGGGSVRGRGRSRIHTSHAHHRLTFDLGPPPLERGIRLQEVMIGRPTTPPLSGGIVHPIPGQHQGHCQDQTDSVEVTAKVKVGPEPPAHPFHEGQGHSSTTPLNRELPHILLGLEPGSPIRIREPVPTAAGMSGSCQGPGQPLPFNVTQGQGPHPHPPRIGAVPKTTIIKIPEGAGATAIAAITGKPHQIRDPYPRSIHVKDKPQSWQTAQNEKKGLRFCCKRCHREFETKAARDLHQNKNKQLECVKFKEDRELLQKDYLNRPLEAPAYAPKFEDDIEEQDPESMCAQIRAVLKAIPSFSELGRPRLPFRDIDEHFRRRDEFMSKEKVEARAFYYEAKARGDNPPKVRYSWSMKNNPKNLDQ